MKRPVIKYDPVIITAVLFFTAHFFYFLLFNRYHLYYQEEIQLFRFDWNYFSGFLERPGGVSDYLGSFLIQFYVLPGIGPLIVTIASMIVYFLSRTMFKRMGLNGLIWSLIPVLFVVALQNDYVFYIGYTVGIILIIEIGRAHV